MGGVINRLPKLLANQIAAGEVVQSPSSVVKELMENSVDAGANYVIVSVKEGGKNSLQVIDDGKGMSPEDAILAFERHATSKIASIDDLFDINTFGFRGEALASIAAVAEVELVTRREEDEVGFKVSINGGTVVDSEPTSYPNCGSQFLVRNLFYNIPARKKSLKKDFTETKRVITEFERVSLCHPKVAFSLYTDDKLLHTLSSTINIRQRITSLLGKNIGNSLLELYVDTSVVEVKGYIGKPEIAKKRPNSFFFVNGRYFESPYLNKAVQNGYEKLIPEGSSPTYFLYLKLDPQNIDVNISPTKTTVRFDEDQAIWQIINAAVRESLGKNGIVPMIDFDASPDSFNLYNSASSSNGKKSGADTPLYAATSKESTVNNEYNPFDESFSFSKAIFGTKDSFRNSFISETESTTENSDHVDKYVEMFSESTPIKQDDDSDIILDSTNFSTNFSNNKTTELLSIIESDSSSDPDSFKSLYTIEEDNSNEISRQITINNPSIDESLFEYEQETEIKQEELFAENVSINNIFIFASIFAVTTIDENIYIFNIKRVVRNLNYYKFLGQIENRSERNVEMQRLLFPVEISLSNNDFHTLECCKEQFLSLGFKYKTSDGSTLVSFDEVPVNIDPSDTEWFLEEILMALKFSDIETYKRSINQQIALSLARTISKRNRGGFVVDEVKYMIEELIKSGNYSYTVDGKPIIVTITAQQLTDMINK